MDPELQNSFEDSLGVSAVNSDNIARRLARKSMYYSAAPTLENELDMFSELLELNTSYKEVVDKLEQDVSITCLEKIKILATLRNKTTSGIISSLVKVSRADLDQVGLEIAWSDYHLEDIEDREALDIISGYFERGLEKQVSRFVTNYYFN